MLDPDDLICDVCDDREQLEAIFEEQGSGHAGDGMSSEDGASVNSQQLLVHQQQQMLALAQQDDGGFIQVCLISVNSRISVNFVEQGFSTFLWWRPTIGTHDP